MSQKNHHDYHGSEKKTDTAAQRSENAAKAAAAAAAEIEAEEQTQPGACQTAEPEIQDEKAEKAETATEATAENADKDQAANAKAGKDWFGKKAREAEALKAKLDAVEKKAEAAKEQLLRTAAEYENYRKRSAREADQKFNDGIACAVNQILPILDTLDMAANANCADENYKKGVVMTLDKATEALNALHIEEIDALGKPFDPNWMNAVQQVPPEEGQNSGDVVRVFQKGYKIGEKIVRHATVVVAE